METMKLAHITFLFPLVVQASPVLQCEIEYGGTTQTLRSVVSHDTGLDHDSDTGKAYTIAATNIADRFQFKAVMLGEGDQPKVIKLYVYYLSHHQPILLQEVKYVAPIHVGDPPFGLTGLNYLYSPPLDRELQYGCALMGDGQ